MSMWLQFALPVIAEIVFFSAAIYCVFRAQKNRIYPALWQYLIFKVGFASVILLEVFVRHMHWIGAVHAYNIYFFTYWPSYLIEGILVLRVLHEMFRHAVRSIPGVQSTGRSIFFWAVAVSLILACASGTASHQSGVGILLAAAQVLMRSQSVLALCMLAFLAFASNKLGVSFGSRIFGIIFGFGLMAVSDLGYTAFFTHNAALSSIPNLVHQELYLVAVSIWCVYFLRPEPVRRLVTLPTVSPLMQWNEIAQSLGNPSGQIAVSYPPSFMTSCIHLVEQVMGPNPTAASGRPPGPVAS